MEKIKSILNAVKGYIIKYQKIILYIIGTIIVLSLLIVSIKIFTNPMNTKITRKNYDNVIEKIRKSSSKDDYEKVQAVIAIYEMASWGEDKDKIDDMEGKSFNQMIKTIQKNIELEEKETQEQKAIAIEKQKIREQYFEVISWGYDAINISTYEKGLKLYLEAKNKKNVDIEAFEGTLTVKDKLGNVLLETTLSCDENFEKKSESEFIWVLSELDHYSAVKDISKYEGKGDKLTFYFDLTKLIVNGKEI